METRAGEAKEPTRDHIPELDGVRGCAIAMVLLFHFAPDLPQNRVLSHILAFGWAGVDLFFVLSGFLITRILIRTRLKSDYFKTFYLRRSLRIFPVYYWALGAVLILFGAVPALRGLIPSSHDQVFYWVYLSNWTPLLHELNQKSLGHFWSLAVEEQFYWIWPFVVRFTNLQWLPWVALGTFSSAVLLRIAFVDSPVFIFRNTFCRTDALMMGALCAIAWQSPAVARFIANRVHYLGGAVPIIVLAVVVGDYWLGIRFTYTAGIMALALAFGALLWYAVTGPQPIRRIFRLPILTKLGKYSYGIYVYHQPIYFAYVQLCWFPRGWPMFGASLLTSVSLAVLSYELAEKHILRLKGASWLNRKASPARI